MNEQTEVTVYCPKNYKLSKQFNIPYLRILEAVAVVGTLMYFLWTIRFTTQIKVLGTLIIGIPLFMILIIGHRGKSIGQVIILSILHSRNKVRLHLRSVNDEQSELKVDNITGIIENVRNKAISIIKKITGRKEQM